MYVPNIVSHDVSKEHGLIIKHDSLFVRKDSFEFYLILRPLAQADG